MANEAVTVLPYGERALLIEVTPPYPVSGAYAAVLGARDAGRLPGVLEVVPAARTVLVTFGDVAATRAGRPVLGQLVPSAPAADAGPEVVIAVHYDGEDLTAVARLTGLDPAEVIRRHTSSSWRVHFVGFAPGFAYLSGGDPALVVPRRDSPRAAVPAGAVGLAGEFSAVYPRPSPGGWQLIGRTEESMWDLRRDPPALLAPGMRVRFEAR
ncbi:MAG: 5-oxoprolinase subunit B family protein [Nostocoides sp.]